MKYTVEKKAGKPAYMQIYDQLRRDIVSGVLPKGAKLPSKRLLAQELGMSVITVEHSYELLTDGGYIRPRQRSGYYADYGAPAPPVRRAALEDMSAELKPMEDFPFSVLARTMRRVLSDMDRRLLIKSPNAGCPELREALADYLCRSRGIVAAPEQILVGAGAEYLYSMAAQLLGRERRFALESPCYEKIRLVYAANGLDCTALPLEEDGISSAALEACDAGVLHITPFHSYPSGVTASAAKRREYVRWAQERGAYIIEDDYDSEFAAAGEPSEPVFTLDVERVIYISTFSKLLAPSMRTGFMILPQTLLEAYKARLGFYSCTVPVFEQHVLAEFINSGDMERYINRRRRAMNKKGERA